MTHLEAVKIYSEKLDLHFKVYVQDETKLAQQTCCILTVHDLASDRKNHK
jgi:hypothetical protein